MDVQNQISAYINYQTEPKRSEMLQLHNLILGLNPSIRLWFLDGRDDKNKTVSNPNIGYGFLTMKLANGKTRDFYQVGMSANTTGISIYIMGLSDKSYLANTCGQTIGKANVSGYCIKFKSLKDINLPVLADVIKSRLV